MAKDQQQLMNVFGSLLSAKGTGGGSDPESDYYKQREKYEKRRMISSIVAPIAGQFLGQLVAAPFREPVNDFLRTQKGRDLYGQWRKHDLNVTDLGNATADIKKYDGSRSEYFLNKASNYTNQQLVERLGEDWYKDSQGPEIDTSTGVPVQKLSPVRGIYTDVMDHVRRIAKIEEQEYLQGIDYYKNFPTQEEFLADVKRYGPRSSNFGQALFRKLKRAFSGQSTEDYIDQSILNITGINTHVFQQKLDEKPDSDYWAMDVETLQEGLRRATETVTPETMDGLIQNATERYWATPTGRARAFENKLALNERESANSLFIAFEGGDLPPFMLNAYKNLLGKRPEGGSLPSMTKLEVQMWEDLGEFTKTLPSNDDIRGSIISGTAFSDYLNGTTTTTTEINKETGEKVEVPTVFPGLNRSLWALQYESINSRHTTLPWIEDADLEGNLNHYIGTGKLTSADRTAFINSRNMAIDEIINAGRMALPVMISEAQRSGQKIPAINDPSLGPSFQRQLLLQAVQGITTDHVERADMTIYQDQRLSVWRGFGPTLFQNALTGKVFQGDSLNKMIDFARDEAELDVETGTGAGPDDIMGTPSPLSPDGLQLIQPGDYPSLAGLDPDIGRDPDITVNVKDLSKMSTDTVQDKRAFGRAFSDSVMSISEGLSPYDPDKEYTLEEIEQRRQNRIETTISMINSLDRTKTDIAGTTALDQTYLPLYQRAVKNLQEEGTPLILELGDGYFVRVAPQTRPHGSPALNAAIENAGGPLLQLTVGTYEDLVKDEKRMPWDKDTEEFVIGRGSSLLGDVPEDITPSEKVFVPIGAGMGGRWTNIEAIEALSNFEDLPPEIQEHLSVMSTRYVSLINELKELGVPAKDIVSGVMAGGPDRFFNPDGGYKGKTEEEQRINELRFGLDIMERSVGVPGFDKAGKRPLMSDLLIQAYADTQGFENEDEADFYDALSDVDLRVITRIKDIDLPTTMPSLNLQQLALIKQAKASTVYDEETGESLLSAPVPQDATLATINKNPWNLVNANAYEEKRKEIMWDNKLPYDPDIEDTYERFKDDLAGMRAGLVNTLTHYKRGKTTIIDLVSTHAPKKGDLKRYKEKEYENPTEAFIEFVSERMDVEPDEKLDLTNPEILYNYAEAVVTFEGFKSDILPELINEGIELAYTYKGIKNK